MARYIDADKLYPKLDKLHGYYDARQDFNKCTAVSFCIEMLEDMPTADVVEVVRCENCTHGKQYSNVVVCHKFGRDTKEDFFCGYGERKEKNDFKE